jgi:hypothetical protein
VEAGAPAVGLAVVGGLDEPLFPPHAVRETVASTIATTAVASSPERRVPCSEFIRYL